MNLSQLIKTHKGARSYADLSRDCGGYPSDKRIQQLVTQTQKNFIDPATVVALAKGLGVPQVSVVLATAETLGLDVARAAPALLDRLPAGVDKLSETQIKLIVDMARSLLSVTETKTIPEQLREVVAHLKWVGPDGIRLEGRDLSDSLDWLVEQMLDGSREDIAALAKQFGMLTHPGAEAVFAQLGISVVDIEEADVAAMQARSKARRSTPTEGENDGPQTPPQKTELEKRRTLNEQEVSDEDETLPEAADDVIPDDDEEPGGSR